MISIAKVTKSWYEIGLRCTNRGMYGKRQNMYEIVRNYVTDDMHDEGADGYWNESFECSSDFEGDLDQINFYYDATSAIDQEILRQILQFFDIQPRDGIDGLIKFTIFDTPAGDSE